MRTSTLQAVPLKVVLAEGSESIGSLSPGAVWAEFAAAGALLLRGFDVDPEAMRAFATEFAQRTVPLVQVHNKTTRSGGVNKLTPSLQRKSHYHHGLGALFYHRENFFRPLAQPDLMFFNCVNPVAGGETLLCDGARLWRQLNTTSREYFSKHKVAGHYYHFGAGQDDGLECLGTVENNNQASLLRALEDSSEGFMAQLNRSSPGIDAACAFRPNEDGKTLRATVTSYMVGASLCSSDEVFCNSFYNYARSEQLRRMGADERRESLRASGVTCDNNDELFAVNMGATTLDDELVPSHVLKEVRRAHFATGFGLVWQPGDLLMLDNTRFMHGRTSFTSTKRELYSYACLVADEWRN